MSVENVGEFGCACHRDPSGEISENCGDGCMSGFYRDTIRRWVEFKENNLRPTDSPRIFLYSDESTFEVLPTLYGVDVTRFWSVPDPFGDRFPLETVVRFTTFPDRDSSGLRLNDVGGFFYNPCLRYNRK